MIPVAKLDINLGENIKVIEMRKMWLCDIE